MIKSDIVVFVCIAFFATAPALGVDNESERTSIDSIRNAVTKNHGKLTSSLDGLEIEALTEYYSVAAAQGETPKAGPLKKTHSTKSTACIRAGSGLIKISNVRSDGGDVPGITIRNPNYKAFIDPAAKGYLLGSLERKKWDRPYELKSSGINFVALSAGFTFNRTDITEIFKDPFIFKSAMIVDYDGKRCVEARWLWKASAIPEGIKIAIVFSPSEDWAIREYREDHPQGNATVKATYRTVENRLLPFEVVSEDYFPGSTALASKHVTSFRDAGKCTCSDQEFYLAYYGLPEPGGSNSKIVYLVVLSVLGVSSIWYAWTKFRAK